MVSASVMSERVSGMRVAGKRAESGKTLWRQATATLPSTPACLQILHATMVQPLSGEAQRYGQDAEDDKVLGTHRTRPGLHGMLRKLEDPHSL